MVACLIVEINNIFWGLHLFHLPNPSYLIWLDNEKLNNIGQSRVACQKACQMLVTTKEFADVRFVRSTVPNCLQEVQLRSLAALSP